MGLDGQSATATTERPRRAKNVSGMTIGCHYMEMLPSYRDKDASCGDGPSWPGPRNWRSGNGRRIGEAGAKPPLRCGCSAPAEQPLPKAARPRSRRDKRAGSVSPAPQARRPSTMLGLAFGAWTPCSGTTPELCICRMDAGLLFVCLSFCLSCLSCILFVFFVLVGCTGWPSLTPAVACLPGWWVRCASRG